MIPRVLSGATASILVSLAGHRTRALNTSGAMAAAIVGTVIVAGLSWPGALVLGAFFVSSSALSRLARDPGIAAKGSQRDARQVLANGGIAALAASSALVTGERRALTLAGGALAAATADTWATEIGSTSRRDPVLIVSRRRVRPGTSGGVTRRGTIAAITGAASIAIITALASGRRARDLSIAPVVTMAGISGSAVDSVLGELVQERRYCPTCDKPTEARTHRCGTPTVLVGGIRGLDNDLVNAACTLTGAVIAGLLGRLVGRSTDTDDEHRSMAERQIRAR